MFPASLWRYSLVYYCFSNVAGVVIIKYKFKSIIEYIVAFCHYMFSQFTVPQ